MLNVRLRLIWVMLNLRFYCIYIPPARFFTQKGTFPVEASLTGLFLYKITTVLYNILPHLIFTY